MNPTDQPVSVRCAPVERAVAERLSSVCAVLLGQDFTLADREAMPILRSRMAGHLLRERDVLAWSIGQAPLFAGTLVRPGGDTDWVILNLSDDPLWTDTDRFPVPDKVLRHLKRLCRAGAQFDTLVIAHEVPRGVCRPGEAVQLEMILPPPPPRAARAARLAGQFSRLAWLVAGLPWLGAAIPVIAAAGGLDPILIGARVRPGVCARPGELAHWYYLCHWTW